MTRHKVLIVGVGAIGERHLRCFLRSGRAELSLCEVNDESRKRIAEQYNVGRTYSDLASALSEPHDAVVICTPGHLHVPMAMQAAEAGLHMLIEKPLSVSLKDVDRLGDMLAERRLIGAVGYVVRAFPEVPAARAAIASGRFGAPRHFTVVVGQHLPTVRPAYGQLYYADHAKGGGAIQDDLTHMLNTMEYFLGPADKLTADAAHQVLEGVEVEDTVNVIGRYGQVLGCYSLNQYQAPNETLITIVCDLGTVQIVLGEHRWQWMCEPNGTWQQEASLVIEADDAFVAQAEAFLDAIEGTGQALCTFDQGVHTLKANLAVLEAAQSHTWQTIGG